MLIFNTCWPCTFSHCFITLQKTLFCAKVGESFQGNKSTIHFIDVGNVLLHEYSESTEIASAVGYVYGE